MTTLREAAQQALEALEDFKRRGHWGDFDNVTGALKAALAEPVQQGCDHCNHPLYAAIKCRVCGRETPIIEHKIKGDKQPVAWIHTDPDKPRVKFLEWRKDEPGYRGDWIKTPLFIAPLGCPNCASLQDQNTELDQKLAELDTALRAQL